MKRIVVVALACASIVAAPAASANAPAHTAVTTKVSGLDKRFLESSIQTDRAEISTGKLALMKSNNRPVRTAAQVYIADHTKLLASTATLARHLGVPVPSSPSPTQVWASQVLASVNGRAFNYWWSSLQVAGHQEAIQLTSEEIAGGSNRAVRDAARMALPMLQAHLRLAQAALRANPNTVNLGC